MAALSDILRDMLAGRETYIQLPGGLRLQYRQPDQASQDHRLLVYRVDIEPSTLEIDTVLKFLRPLLPAECGFRLAPPIDYTGADGRSRLGRAITWQAMPVQAGLFGGNQ